VSFDVLSVKIGPMNSPVGEQKNKKVNMRTGNILPIWGAKTPRRIEPKFLFAGRCPPS